MHRETMLEFIRAAIKMRAAQKLYFKSRSRDDLIQSKQLESALDKMADAIQREWNDDEGDTGP